MRKAFSIWDLLGGVGKLKSTVMYNTDSSPYKNKKNATKKFWDSVVSLKAIFIFLMQGSK